MSAEYSHNGICVPPQTLHSIDRYIAHGIPAGGFLGAVLANDLRGASLRADASNQIALVAIVAYLEERCPKECWGSYERVDKWIKFNRAMLARIEQEKAKLNG